MTTKEKIGNAGHYEELPRRVMGTSSYVGITFTPGAKKGGAPMTHDDVIHRNASEYCRQAWDAAVDTHTWIRGVRKAALGGKPTLRAGPEPSVSTATGRAAANTVERSSEPDSRT